MTPSGWENDTRGRDAGHDELQLTLWRYLKKRPTEPIQTKNDGTFSRVSVTVEHPFMVKGIPIAFADVCEVFRSDQVTYDNYWNYRYVAYEIKPRIYSVGGIIRQCMALEVAIERSGPTRASGKKPEAVVVPVVLRSDPKAEMLKEMYGPNVWTWDDPVGSAAP